MILKKLKRRVFRKPKATMIRELIAYIMQRQDENGIDKLAYYGAKNFITGTLKAQQAEMIDLAAESVRSPMPVTHWCMSWQENMKTKGNSRAPNFQRRRTLRLSERDDARMVEYAAVAGLSVSEYMRRLFLGGRPIIASTDDQMIRELRRMGGLLKHLGAEKPNATAEMRETLASICKTIERLAART